ncbi:DUF1294 domain-containing protein [Miniphocaeibacter massiliensis]|uniref:DUF1294 domain-containing protein n=1 Tax=Miniphocaeibacter massiliensis TaxID=2041841 RepID=UPI000C1C40AE
MVIIIKFIYIFFILVNLFSFAIYGIDKLKAIKGKYRIPESVLLFSTLISGFLGSILAMLLFKHKLSKKKFVVVALLSSIFYLALLGTYIFNLVHF